MGFPDKEPATQRAAAVRRRTGEAIRHFPDHPALIAQRAEALLLAQNPGLGKFVWDMFQNGSSETLAQIMVAVFTIGLIGFVLDRDARRLVVVSCLDNLGKGAAGQAVQNANLMNGFDETAGLLMPPPAPV